MEQSRRSALADHVHRITPMGTWVLINGTWYKPALLRLLTAASLIGRSGSSTFRPSTTPVSMSLAGSCFSSDSAPKPLYGAFFVKEFARAAHLFPSSVS